MEQQDYTKAIEDAAQQIADDTGIPLALLRSGPTSAEAFMSGHHAPMPEGPGQYDRAEA